MVGEFALVMVYAMPLKCAFDVIWYFLPTAFRLGPWGEIVTDLVEIDGFEILARPVRGERFLPECLQSAQAELAHPIRVLFDVRDVVNSPLAQSGARIAHVSFRVKEIALTAINIDGCRFGFHLMLPRKYGFSDLLACPIVTALFELKSEFFSSAPNASPSYHHVDVIRNDVVQ